MGNLPTLTERIKRMIALEGPMDIATFMALALGDPEQGYYMTRDPFGEQGDFTTAPEISQLFGEILGVWMLYQWHQAGRPAPFHLAELGPGRGTLMQDMVRAISQDPQAREALILHMVETSPVLIKAQKQKLALGSGPLNHHTSIESLPDGPLFITANEFLDALPIHQWIHHKHRWHERIIGLNEEGELAFGLGPTRDIGSLTPPEEPQDGAIWEQNPLGEAICQELGLKLAQNGGSALFIDYGYAKSALGDSLQALKGHTYANILHNVGNQDLTTHVNFEAMKRATLLANKADNITKPITTHLINQGQFLLNLGLLERAGQLGTGKSHEEQEAIRDAVERLAAPEQMGDLFKVLAIVPQGIDAPGFSN